MKKMMSIVIIIHLILSLLVVNGNVATNTASPQYIKLLMEGKLINFKVANLSLNDQLIQSDVPPVIHEDRTLVPLRVIMENTDAGVTWNKSTQEVTLKTIDKVIVLQINNGVAKVDGGNVPLPDGVPPKLISDRTMVPIRFIAETIGIGVNWNNTTQTVELKYTAPVVAESARASAITVKNNGYYPEIRIKTSEEVAYTESTLTNPTRLIFDFKNVKFDIEDKTNILGDGTYRRPLENNAVKVIRAAQFKLEPQLETRMVLEMGDTATPKVHYDKTTGEMVISFTNYVNNVKVDERNMKEVVIIEGDDVKSYNVMRLNNPERLVVDVKNAYLKDANYQLDVNGKMAKSIRVSQFTPDQHYKPDDKIVRIVIDLQPKTQYPEFQFEVVNNQLIVHLEGKPYSTLKYETVGFTTSKLTLQGNAITQYKVSRLPNNILEILVPKSNGTLDFTDITVGDNMIEGIKVDSTTSKEHHRVLVEVTAEVEHTVLTPLSTKDLEVQFKNKNRYRELLIIIDPGHGGTDPGAISPNLKLKETNIVLDVAQRLNKLLLAAGFRTYMTRTTDTFITLQDRAGVANQLNGNLFVSIHANAASKPSAEGIENLYYPSEINPNDSRDNKKLAQVFQNTMVSELGARNRGIVARDKIYVIRETKMPAVLTEMGFLTNPVEESKLATEAYRQKVAESLFKSIVKYYE